VLPPGSVLGNRYQITRPLGQGGMSNIYLCQDLRLGGKQVVIKEFTARYSDPREQALAVEHFKREAELLAKLDHRNLPKVYDYFESQNRYYLVMEFVDGEDLGRILARARGPLPERQVTEWATQIATVLYYLHCHRPDPIIFRDVKPSNIILAGNTVKLIDFGIARHFNPAKKGDTMRIGSPGYAPPEQYSGQTDPRSDVYSLGVTLHQCLTGRDPTTTQTPFNLPPVRQLNPAVSEEMTRIIEKATRLDPSERYQSMLDMKRDLQTLAASQRGGTSVVRTAPGVTGPVPAAAGPAATPAPVGPIAAVASAPPRQPRPRRRLPLAPVAAILLMIGLTLGLLFAPPDTHKRVLDLLGRLLAPAAPTQPGPLALRLYEEGAPVEQVLALLDQAREEGQSGPLLDICRANSLALAAGAPVNTLGVLLPQDRPDLLRGLALAQGYLNDQGGVQGRKILLVVETVQGNLARGAARLFEGRAGRRSPQPRGPRGQTVEAVLALGPDDELEKVARQAARYNRPLLLVGSRSAPGGPRLRWLPVAPALAAEARAVAALKGPGALCLDGELARQLAALGMKVETAPAPARPAEVPALVDKAAGRLIVVRSSSPQPVLEALVQEASGRPGASLLVLTGSLTPPLAALRPSRPGGRVQALAACSVFSPWPAAAAFARAADPEASARAYDALLCLSAWSGAALPPLQGASLGLDAAGQPLTPPFSLFALGAEGWVFQESRP
jgi:tRNA A-37 threonylcarbamoyl transferase component Bud32